MCIHSVFKACRIKKHFFLLLNDGVLTFGEINTKVQVACDPAVFSNDNYLGQTLHIYLSFGNLEIKPETIPIALGYAWELDNENCSKE